jgi:putative toxin-antitoxin system antitoxin component (TIGR02293 family)
MAEDILGSRDAASRWMQESNRSLGGETPLDYAETEVGAREVEDLLGRISHGIAA